MSRRFSSPAPARRLGLCVAAAFAVAVLAAGCASRPPIVVGPKDSAVRMTAHGAFVGDSRVEVRDVPGLLEDSDVPFERTIHIRVDKDVRDLRQARLLMNHLARAGYRSSVLVTERHSESFVPKDQKPRKRK